MKRTTRGMTLIEVLVALVILGTLLVSTIVARGRYLRQSALARRKLAAITVVDAMLADWTRQPESLPDHASGPMPNDKELTWRAETIERDDVRRIGARVLSVRVFEHRPDGEQTTDSTAALVSVELLVPSKEAAQKSVTKMGYGTEAHNVTP